VRSVDSEKVGREESSSEIDIFVEADAVAAAEGSIQVTDKRGHQEPPESQARGTLSKGFPRNLGQTSASLATICGGQRVAPVKGDRRQSVKDTEEAYEPVVLMTTGN